MVIAASQESAVFVVCWVRAIVRILSIGTSLDRFFYLMAKRYDGILRYRRSGQRRGYSIKMA
jgi:hypothetical protein